MNTLQNILMTLGTNVEQNEMTCCVQEQQLWRDWGGGGGGGGGGGHLFFFLRKPFSS